MNNLNISLHHTEVRHLQKETLIDTSERNFADPFDAPDLALETLRRVTGVLDHLNINYMTYDGTLLGIIRQGGFIPGDNDLDLCIPRSDFSPDLFEAMAAAGLQPVWRTSFDGVLANCRFSYGDMPIDLSGWSPEPGLLVRQFGFRNGFLVAKSPACERVKTSFLGQDIWIPKSPEETLTALYGPDWRLPVQSWDHMFSIHNLTDIFGNSDALINGTRRWLKAHGHPPNINAKKAAQ